MRWALLAGLLLGAGPAVQEKATLSGKVAVTAGAKPKKRLVVRYTGPGLEFRKDPSPSFPVVWLEGPPAVKAEGRTAELRQEGLEFRPRVLAVQAGTVVKFPNDDDLQHNVFSYSRTRRFDLGRYAKGESKDVVFDQKGVVDVACEIHQHMRGFIVVVDHPHFAVADKDGAFTIPDVPPGSYTLAAWAEGFDPVRQPVEVKAGAGPVEIRIASARDVDLPPERTATAVCCAK
jgi:plastocyanin